MMRVLIAVPTLESVPVEFMESLMALVCHLKDEGVDFKLKVESCTLVYLARENLARWAIANRYTHILWLDSDMVFGEEIVEDLQFSGQDFVTGIAHSRRPPFSSCLFSTIFPGVEKFKGEYPRNTFRVAACGMACALMSVKVLEAVRDKFGTMFSPMHEPMTYGEDVAFCYRATQCGFSIWAEPGVKVGHVGRRIIWPEDTEVTT